MRGSLKVIKCPKIQLREHNHFYNINIFLGFLPLMPSFLSPMIPFLICSKIHLDWSHVGFREQNHSLCLMGFFYFCIGQLFLLFPGNKQSPVLRGLQQSGFIAFSCYMLWQVNWNSAPCICILELKLKEKSTVRPSYSLGIGGTT